VKSGKLGLFMKDVLIEELVSGSFFGESSIIPGERPEGMSVKVIESSEVYLLPGLLLNDIPVSRWKMLQSKQQRILRARNLMD